MWTVLFTITRFAHIMTAIVLVGGSTFIRFVLLPAATQALSPEAHSELRAKVMSIWKRFIHRGIGILIISGGINYWRVISTGDHKGDGLYHGLMGTKILLALGVFFIASALVGKSAKFESFRQNAKKWLVINQIGRAHV